MQQRSPDHLALVRAAREPAREQQPLLAKAANRRGGRTGADEGVKEGAHRVLDLCVGVEHDVSGAVVDQAHGQPHLQFAAARLGELTADQTSA